MMSKLLKLLVSGTLLALLAWRMDWARVGQHFAHLRIDLWAAALALYVATQVASSLRWQLLAQPLGFREPLSRYLRYYFIGMYFNLFLPTSVGGDVVRAWYLDGGSGRRLAAFLSTFADRFSGLLVLLALACAAVILCPVAIPGWVALSVWAVAGCGLLGVATLWLFRRWLKKFHSARHLLNGVRLYIGKYRLLWLTSGLSFLVQAGNVALVWLLGQAINVEVPGSYYWILVPMISLLTLLPISINGLGVREAGVVLLLAPFHIDRATALSLSFLWFSIFTAASLMGGAVYLFGSFPRPEVRTDDESVRGDPGQGRAGEPEASPQPSSTGP
jgi:uncharacterized membrane protein YbhN (UPF0104 family)